MEPGREKESTSHNSENIEYRIGQSLDSFKNKASIPPNTRIKVTDKTDGPDGFLKITVSYMGEHSIKTPELNQEVLVSTPLTAELYLDKEGNLVKYQIHEPDHIMIDTLEQELNSRLKTGQIHFIDSNEKVSTSELFAKQKPFYIQKDDQGKQHLKRAYFSSY
jgi:hypothetical protein